MQIKKMMPEDLEQIQVLYRELVPEGCPLTTIKKYYEDSKINSLKVHLFLFFYKQRYLFLI